MPYTIDSVFSAADVALIEQSMAIVQNRTARCITFRRQVSTDTNWINIVKREGCWSYMGRLTRGAQELSLGTGCVDITVIIHELYHALGFHHEQNRLDRDQFIRVNLANVDPNFHSAFTIQQATQTFGLPYDYDSVMQYHRTAFSVNGQETITPLNGQRSLGATVANPVTGSDIYSLRVFYGCAAPLTVQAFRFTIANNFSFPLTLRQLTPTAGNPITVASNARIVQDSSRTHQWSLTSQDPSIYNKRFVLGVDNDFLTTGTVFVPIPPFSFTVFNTRTFPWSLYEGSTANPLIAVIQPGARYTHRTDSSRTWVFTNAASGLTGRFTNPLSTSITFNL